VRARARPDLPDRRHASRQVMLFSAHPDDIEAAAGGMVALLTAQGTTVQYVIVTNGDKGCANAFCANFTSAQIAAVRAQEAVTAAQVLVARRARSAARDTPSAGLARRAWRQATWCCAATKTPWSPPTQTVEHSAAARRPPSLPGSLLTSDARRGDAQAFCSPDSRVQVRGLPIAPPLPNPIGDHVTAQATHRDELVALSSLSAAAQARRARRLPVATRERYRLRAATCGPTSASTLTTRCPRPRRAHVRPLPSRRRPAGRRALRAGDAHSGRPVASLPFRRSALGPAWALLTHRVRAQAQPGRLSRSLRARAGSAEQSVRPQFYMWDFVEPTHFVGIDSVVDLKGQAFLAHRSQNPDNTTYPAVWHGAQLAARNTGVPLRQPCSQRRARAGVHAQALRLLGARVAARTEGAYTGKFAEGFHAFF
jgi:LmbE family N-acetylglucosaminyl deacetylase